MSTMLRYTNKGPYALPTDYGHTVQGILNSTYFKNLNITYDKLTQICLKINAIKNSLSDASGSDINKVNDDLNNVYNAFHKLQTKIDERGSAMLDSAIKYDNVYEDKRNQIGTKIYNKKTTIDHGSAYLFPMYRYWDKICETDDTIEDVEYDTDGYIYLKVKRSERTVERQNKSLWVFANAGGDYDMEEVSNPVTKTYTYRLKVFPNGTYESIENITFLSPLYK